MTLPETYNPVWRDVVTGRRACDFSFLATKIFLGRARFSLKMDSSPQNVASLIKELHGLFAKNLNHPSVINDIQQLVD